MAYFDNNATTSISENALEVYRRALAEDWHNPSSPYRSSARIRARMELDREELAKDLGLKKEEIIFTSGATEANNGVFAHFATQANAGLCCLVSPFEHPSILEPARYWFKDKIRYLPIDQEGRVVLENIENLLSENNICFVSLMAANNETGVLQPWKELAEICFSKGVFFHCDATQWIGKLPSDDFDLCSSFSVSAHKFSGPKGAGWFASKEPISMQLGGEQEMSKRGGTENYPAITSMLTAWKEVRFQLNSPGNRTEWRDQFEKSLINLIPAVKILGLNSPRLWNTSMFVLPDFENLSWVGKLDKLGFSVSTGSACSTGKAGHSGIAQSMGLSTSEVRRLIRVSSYWEHGESDWVNLLSAFEQVSKELHQEGAYSSVISF